MNSELRIGFLPVLLYVKRGEETKSAVDLASALCAYIKSPNMRTMPGKAWRIRSERHFSIEKMVKSYETERYMEEQHPCKRIHMLTNLQMPEVKAVIEIPRGSFLKRGWNGSIDFVSPFPCPFNYGSIPDYIGGEGDLLDAVVLGPRLPRGKIVSVIAQGSVGLTDRGMYDDKLICSNIPLTVWQKRFVLIFFHVYGLSKRLLNFYRGRSGLTYCNGWGSAANAIARARPRKDMDWNGPLISF